MKWPKNLYNAYGDDKYRDAKGILKVLKLYFNDLMLSKIMSIKKELSINKSKSVVIYDVFIYNKNT